MISLSQENPKWWMKLLKTVAYRQKEASNVMDLTLRHVHVVGSHDVKSDMREETPKSSKSSNGDQNSDHSSNTQEIYSPGPCKHNRKFACVFIPCTAALLFIGGEILFAVLVICLLIVYLVDFTSKYRKSSLVAFVLCVIVVQAVTVYCLIPYLWKSLLYIGLLFFSNVFIVLSGGLGLLQFKQLQIEEPKFVIQLEYVMFVAYPMAGQFVMMFVSSLVTGVWTMPYWCIVYGFIFTRVFYPPSKPSFTYGTALHQPGEEAPPESFILGPIEKVLLLVNCLTAPGSIFIFLNIFNFLQIRTWVRLLLCGFTPLFLVTCLDIKRETDFLDQPQELVQRVKWTSGLLSMLLLGITLYDSGMVTGHVAPFLFLCVLLSLLVSVSADKKNTNQLYLWVSCAALALAFVGGLCTLPWTLQFNFQLFSLPLLVVEGCIALLAILAVACIAVSCGSRDEWLNLLIVLHSLGFVLCEAVLMVESFYPFYAALGSGVLVSYVSWRLYRDGKLYREAAWFCTSLHCSKIPACIAAVQPQAAPAAHIFPHLFSYSPAILAFCLALIVSKLLLFEHRNNVPFQEGLQYCLATGLALLVSCDVIIVSLWFMTTFTRPTPADALASILMLWGVVCVKLSYFHLSYSLLARRLNILILCTAVFVEALQPEFDPNKLSGSAAVSWLVLVSLGALVSVLVRLFSWEACALPLQMSVAMVIGIPLGLKIAVMFVPSDSNVLVSLPYGFSAGVVTFLLISSRAKHSILSSLAGPYIVLLVCGLLVTVLDVVSESDNIQHSPTIAEYDELFTNRWPSTLYYATLHFLLAIGLKKGAIRKKETLEETKSALMADGLLQSSSFIANLSVFLTFSLAVIVSPIASWELWVVMCSLVLSLVRPEGIPSLPSLMNPKRFSRTLPVLAALVVCLYGRTIQTALPQELGFLSLVGFVLEMIFLHLAVPTFFVPLCALWRGEISHYAQYVALQCAPSNVVLVVYCSTVAGRILGLLGIAGTYWMFFYVRCFVEDIR